VGRGVPSPPRERSEEGAVPPPNNFFSNFLTSTRPVLVIFYAVKLPVLHA